jgi:hypothetical protein
MTMKTSIPLTEGEWNVILHALNYKTMDKQNSSLAQKQYEGLYNKLIDIREESN